MYSSKKNSLVQSQTFKLQDDLYSLYKGLSALRNVKNEVER